MKWSFFLLGMIECSSGLLPGTENSCWDVDRGWCTGHKLRPLTTLDLIAHILRMRYGEPQSFRNRIAS